MLSLRFPLRAALAHRRISFFDGLVRIVMALAMTGSASADEDLSVGVPKKPAVAPPAGPAVSAPAVRLESLAPPIAPGQSAEEAWFEYFRSHPEIPPGNVRETVRVLAAANKHDHVSALIQAALTNDQAQPWMYEALAIALQAQNAPREDVERALMSAVDLAESVEELFSLADYLEKFGYERRALDLYRTLANLVPAHPEPFVRGLVLARRLNDTDATRWACLGILGQVWSRRDRAVGERAARVAEALLKELKARNRVEELARFAAQIDEALKRDCIVLVNWTGDADVDLLVEEPSGTVCSSRHPRTTSGGVMIGDVFSHPSAKTVNGFTEMYVCREGFAGPYRILLRRIWGQVTNGTVNVEVHLGVGEKEHYRVMKKQIPLSDKDAIVQFELEEGRRTEALSEQQIAQVARTQLAIRRDIIGLGRALDSTEDSLATRSLTRDRQQQVRAGVLPGGRRPRGAGFRPEITTLPEGANMQATAIISADRRYVRISPMPLFSQIGEVNTFTFAGGAAGGAGGGNLGGGGGNPGGGGGAGGFGGGGAGGFGGGGGGGGFGGLF